MSAAVDDSFLCTEPFSIVVVVVAVVVVVVCASVAFGCLGCWASREAVSGWRAGAWSARAASGNWAHNSSESTRRGIRGFLLLVMAAVPEELLVTQPQLKEN